MRGETNTLQPPRKRIIGDGGHLIAVEDAIVGRGVWRAGQGLNPTNDIITAGMLRGRGCNSDSGKPAIARVPENDPTR